MKEIREIIALYDQLKTESVAAALAVVADVEQSSYRRIGARLLVAADGRYVGGISGGCLEGDALKRAARAIATGRPAVHTYDTTDGEDAVIGIGLGCEGRIDVLFVPLDYADPRNEVELLRRFVDTRQPRLLLRLLSVRREEDWNAGWALPVLPKNGDQLVSYTGLSSRDVEVFTRATRELGRSRATSLQAADGTEFRVLCEVLHPTVHLVLTGANYDIPAALRAARLLGWHTTVVGPARRLTRSIAVLADHCLDYDRVEEVAVDAATAVVLMSHDYDRDRKMVRHFLPLKPRYFGMLGPRKRMLKMAAELPDLNLEGFPGLYAPVGIDIGAETPEEIAMSLVAEVVMVFRGRSGGALRERPGSIH